jgi:hypothetical protein
MFQVATPRAATHDRTSFTNVVAQVERAWRPQQQCRGETAAAKNGNRQWPRAKTHESSLSLSRLDDLRPNWWALFMETHDDATPAAVRPIQGGSSTKINAANLLQGRRRLAAFVSDGALRRMAFQHSLAC